MRAIAAVVVASWLTLAGPATAWAQDTLGARRFAVDSVIAVQDMFLESDDWPTQLIVDSVATLAVRDGVALNLRPKLWRVGGQWASLLDQASVRLDVVRRAKVRIEAGRFPSPIGLGMLENRANQNDGVLWCHRLYYGELPTGGAGAAPRTLISAVYPVGVSASASTARWDVRAAALDRALVDPWRTPTRGRSMPSNFVTGAGYSPRQGLRVGAATAWSTATFGGRRSGRDADYRLLNVEGEWSWGYSRLSGEWTRSTFETPTGTQVATGMTLQARHTLSPRVFAHSRVTVANAPRATPSGLTTTSFRAVDSTVGYRVSPEVTLRAGHSAVKNFSRSALDHQLAVSVVWVRRWW